MPDFEPGGRRSQVKPDEIHLGNFQRGGAVTIRLKDLARHGLIAGLPGSGKTNTCLYLLSQLQERHVPFLVIEPAKTEYRGLIRQPGFENLLVFTLGDETTAPFRLNPFELLPGVRLEVHLEALNVAINAAMPQFGVLPSIIEEALEEIYAAKGWRLADTGPKDAGSGPDRRLFPTLAEFYRRGRASGDGPRLPRRAERQHPGRGQGANRQPAAREQGAHVQLPALDPARSAVRPAGGVGAGLPQRRRQGAGDDVPADPAA